MTMPTKWDGERVIIRPILLDGLRSELLIIQEEYFVKDKWQWCKAVNGAKQSEKARRVD
jgi:hypothetical protein